LSAELKLLVLARDLFGSRKVIDDERPFVARNNFNAAGLHVFLSIASYDGLAFQLVRHGCESELIIRLRIP
jgi:hypothetical protein